MIHAIVGAVSLAAFTAFVLGALVADAWILTDAALVRVAAMHALGRFCHFILRVLNAQPATGH